MAAVLLSPVLSSAREAGRDSTVLERTISFRFDSAVFDESYRDNAAALRDIDSVLRNTLPTCLQGVEVVSVSSPEGTYPHNVILSRQRSETVAEYLRSHYPDISGRFSATWKDEGWEELRSLVSDDQGLDSYDKSRILKALDPGVSVDTRKWRMSRLASYSYIQAYLFPRIRSSVVRIVSSAGASEAVSLTDSSQDVTDAQALSSYARENAGVHVEGNAAGSQQPAEPSQPETPAEPVTPVQPETPVEPLQPETASESTVSDDVAEPETPAEPAEPVTPAEPQTPAEPTVTEQAETPAEPAAEPLAVAQEGSAAEWLCYPFAIKTNLLFDAALALNAEIEVPLSDRVSIGLEWTAPWWLEKHNHWCYRANVMNFEAKWWWGDRSVHPLLDGWFSGLYADTGRYDLQNSSKGVQGTFWNVGVGGGYSWSLGRNWGLEAMLGLGLFDTRYETFVPREDYTILAYRQTLNTTFFGPTRAKVSIFYKFGQKWYDRKYRSSNE